MFSGLRKEKQLEMKKEDMEGKPDNVKEKIVTGIDFLLPPNPRSVGRVSLSDVR